VSYLHPATAGSSYAYGVGSGPQVAGYVDFGAYFDAGLWSGPAWAFTDLGASLSTNNQADGVGDGQQVGYRYGPGFGETQAVLWTGTSASAVTLTPPGSPLSFAYGASGGHQVGAAVAPLGNNSVHASLWSGTAASWTDLHPAGADDSILTGVSGNHQIGYASISGVDHAGLWTGTPASFLDLNPAGASQSRALACDASQQAGYAQIIANHACIWTGSAASWTDLNPAGATSSKAMGVCLGQQVGEADFGGVDHAIVWSGTAASWQDLSSALSGSWDGAAATGIWSDGVTVYICGYGARQTPTPHAEALLWRRAITAPACYPNCDASSTAPVLNVLDFACFLNRFAAGDSYANCDNSTTPPALNVLDFACFLNAFAAGCS
jgi:hypothetical protein